MSFAQPAKAFWLMTVVLEGMSKAARLAQPLKAEAPMLSRRSFFASQMTFSRFAQPSKALAEMVFT